MLVQNGRFVPGLGSTARDLLVDAGLHVRLRRQRAGPARRPDADRGARTPTDASLQWGADIAKALGVPASDVRVATEGQSIADVIVVLGTDFPPPDK